MERYARVKPKESVADIYSPKMTADGRAHPCRQFLRRRGLTRGNLQVARASDNRDKLLIPALSVRAAELVMVCPAISNLMLGGVTAKSAGASSHSNW